MKNFKAILFLVLCGSLGVGLGTAFTRFWHGNPPKDSHPGAGSPPLLRGFALPPTASPDLFKPLLQFHTSALALQYPNSPDILQAAVAHAHSLGLKIILQPTPNFSSKCPYPHPLAQIAAEAQTAGVDILCVSWLSTDPTDVYWQKQIADARKNFRGPLLLASTVDVLPQIEFASAVDLLGVIGPVNLPRRLPHAAVAIDLHDLRIAWACQLDALESLSNHTGKKIVLLNMSVPEAYATKIPLSAADAPLPDPALQTLVYQALLEETRGRPNIDALFLRWSPQNSPQQIAPDPTAVNHLPALLTDLVSDWAPAAAPATNAVAATDPDNDDTDADADTDQ